MASNDKANNVIRVQTSVGGRFFRIWVEFLTPIHNLTDREKDILAEFIKQRFILAESISDEDLLDKVIMSDDIKVKVRDTCGVSKAFFQMIMSKFKKTGIIDSDGRINKRFIPKELNKKDKTFRFLLYFELDEKYN